MEPRRSKEEIREHGEDLLLNAIDSLVHVSDWIFPAPLVTRKARLTAAIELLERELERLDRFRIPAE
jgi:hypothetical protein